MNTEVYKPFGSRIKLTKNDNYLEIIIVPTKSNSPDELSTTIKMLLFFVFIIFMIFIFSTNFQVIFQIFFFISIISIYLWVSGLFNRPKFRNLSASYSLRLRVDNERKITFNNYFSEKEDISELIYIPQVSIKEFVYPACVYIDSIRVQAQLEIWAGVKKYQVGNNETDIVLSEAEIKWLAHELSNWLGIPLNGKVSKNKNRP